MCLCRRGEPRSGVRRTVQSVVGMGLYVFAYTRTNACYCTYMSTSDPASFRVYNAESLGRAVRYFREQEGLTQAQLAARLRIRRPTLVDIEAGRMTAQTRRLIEIFKVLGARITIQKADW